MNLKINMYYVYVHKYEKVCVYARTYVNVCNVMQCNTMQCNSCNEMYVMECNVF